MKQKNATDLKRKKTPKQFQAGDITQLALLSV